MSRDVLQELLGIPPEVDVDVSLSELELDQFKTVLKSGDGRAVFWKILGLCGIYRTTFTTSSSELAAHLEGRRALGLDILNLMREADSGVYIRMQTEQLEKDSTKQD